jgi:hypothetical protein
LDEAVAVVVGGGAIVVLFGGGGLDEAEIYSGASNRRIFAIKKRRKINQ